MDIDREIRRSHERSRSPPYRGSKRSRDDDYADRNRGDPRRFKVHYEDDPQDYKRHSRVSYEDIDHGSASTSELRMMTDDRYAEKRPRTRSRHLIDRAWMEKEMDAMSSPGGMEIAMVVIQIGQTQFLWARRRKKSGFKGPVSEQTGTKPAAS